MPSTETKPNLKSNFLWLSFDRFFRLGGTYLTFVLLARFWGKQMLGEYSYVLAYIAPFQVLATLGLENILIRDLVKLPELTKPILLNSLRLRLISGMLALFLIPLGYSFLEPEKQSLMAIIGVLAITPLLQAYEVYDYWFQSQVLSKYSVIARNLSFFLGLLAKIWILTNTRSLFYFAAVTAAEFLLTSLGLNLFYQAKANSMSLFRKKIDDPRWNWSLNKRLLSDSWPLALACLMQIIYARIDQVMIGQWIGPEAVGIYSVAIQITEGTFVLPMIFFSTLLPQSIGHHQKSPELYKRNLQKTFSWMIWGSIILAAFIASLSGPIISVIYGSNFQEAADLLKICVWSLVFVSIAVASSNYLLANNLTHVTLYRTALGALCNLMLNYFLIPKLGMKGAAIASLISYTIVALSLVLFKPCRSLGKDIFNAFIFPKFV